METVTGKAKEDGVNPEVNETSIPIVTRAMGTEDTGATAIDNDGAPKGIPPYPRTTRNQTIAQPLAK